MISSNKAQKYRFASRCPVKLRLTPEQQKMCETKRPVLTSDDQINFKGNLFEIQIVFLVELKHTNLFYVFYFNHYLPTFYNFPFSTN